MSLHHHHAGLPSGLVVRRADPDDWQQVRAARLAALESEPERFGTALAQDLRMTRDDWVGSLTSNRWLLAQAGSTTVGLVALFPDDTYPDGLPQLGAMWVAPPWRGRRVAAALERGVADLASAQGARGIGLWVTDGNDAAEAAYAAMGYARTGATKPAPRDPAVQMHRMARLLPG